MGPDPDADAVIDVEARTVEAPEDAAAPALPGATTGAHPGTPAHRATPPRRGSHFLE
jgi:hypothetical protein